MEKIKDSKALLVFILLIIASIIIYIINKEKELSDYKKTTSAKITDYYTTERGKKYIEYVFFVHGKKYTGRERVSSFKCRNGKAGCVGITFKVFYSSIDPSNCSIDLGKYNKFKARSRVFNLLN